MGGRGSSSGKTPTREQVLGYTKRTKTLNAQISRLENNISIAEGRISMDKAASFGATESGRKRLASAKRTYKKDKSRLAELRSERDDLNKKIEKYRRSQNRRAADVPF